MFQFFSRSCRFLSSSRGWQGRFYFSSLQVSVVCYGLTTPISSPCFYCCLMGLSRHTDLSALQKVSRNKTAQIMCFCLGSFQSFLIHSFSAVRSSSCVSWLILVLTVTLVPDPEPTKPSWLSDQIKSKTNGAQQQQQQQQQFQIWRSDHRCCCIENSSFFGLILSSVCCDTLKLLNAH